jgi:metal-responsive CopG/Arc/MetJ family transcriptional regulator
MKVAVSIPNETLDEAKLLAKRLKTSRSDLYSRALREFIGRRAPERVTQAMNDAVDAAGSEPNDFSCAASRRVLSRAAWR